MIVLCPNHHADFDNGVVRIDIDDRSVEHPFDTDVDGNLITFEGDHNIADRYIMYHNENVCTLR